jgi:hypothetical protein
MFKVKSLSIGAAAAVSLLTACTALQVRSDVNPRQSVALCHSYAWAPEIRDPRGREEANPLNAERLRAAVDANLQSHGLRPAEPAGADCLVGFEVGSQRYVDAFPAGPGWGWGMGLGWGWRRGYAGLGWEQPYVYREGFIAVNLYDSKAHTPLWHAVVNQDIAGLTGSKAEEKINAAVAAIFTKYPT